MVDEKIEQTYYRCSSCGFIYLDDTSIVSTIVEKKHYEKHNNSFECAGYVAMFEKFFQDTIQLYAKEIKTILDFGCGEEAVFSQILKKKGFEVDVYDLYFHPEKIYKSKKYDLITSTEVFEHLKEPQSVLQELTSSLNSKGYLILMTKFPPKDDKEFLDWWYRRDITHISFFTPKSFEIMGNEVGLNVLKTLDDNIVVFQKC
jgi:predicted TPR repeat methyltransferase/rubredoxin